MRNDVSTPSSRNAPMMAPHMTSTRVKPSSRSLGWTGARVPQCSIGIVVEIIEAVLAVVARIRARERAAIETAPRYGERDLFHSAPRIVAETGAGGRGVVHVGDVAREREFFRPDFRITGETRVDRLRDGLHVG